MPALVARAPTAPEEPPTKRGSCVTEESDFRARVAAERRHAREGARSLVEAVTRDDFALFVRGLHLLESHAIMNSGWVRAARKLARLRPPSAAFRAEALDLWHRNGDHLRVEVGRDLVLVDILRVVLPPYAGSDLRLWRGEGALNRRQRTYGMSWTCDRAVARSFAENNRRRYVGGTVVLEADVPAKAILCADADHLSGSVEAEYIVDRRCLQQVRVIERLRP